MLLGETIAISGDTHLRRARQRHEPGHKGDDPFPHKRFATNQIYTAQPELGHHSQEPDETLVAQIVAGLTSIKTAGGVKPSKPVPFADFYVDPVDNAIESIDQHTDTEMNETAKTTGLLSPLFGGSVKTEGMFVIVVGRMWPPAQRVVCGETDRPV